MKLTAVQTKYLPGVLWITDPFAYAEGRSTLMAYAFLMHAVQYVGKSIPVWDHTPSYPSKLYTTRLVEDLFKEMHLDQRYTLTHSKVDGTIRLDRLKDVKPEVK